MDGWIQGKKGEGEDNESDGMMMEEWMDRGEEGGRDGGMVCWLDGRIQGRMIRGEERLAGLSGPGGYKDPRNERLLSLLSAPSLLLLPLSSSSLSPPHRPELAAICGDGGPGTQRRSGSAPSALRHPPSFASIPSARDYGAL